MADLVAWKNSVLNKHLDTDGIKDDAGQCSQVPLSWAEVVFPGVKWQDLLPEVGSDHGVKDWAGKSTQYFTWIENNHADVNQLPLPGDILVFGATPAKGFTNQFKNDFGHTGVCETASPSGYTLIQQNSPNLGEGVNDTSYPWNYRPCLGWFRPTANHPVAVATPASAPIASNNVGRTLVLPKSIKEWHVYNPEGPYDVAHAIHILSPAQFGGLNYEIKADLGNGIYLIDTEMYGRVAIWTQGTVATIS